MSARRVHRVSLVDTPDEAERTTASLVGSLAARLIALHYTSGVSVIGSVVAGLAALGREVSTTAEGARLRRALEAGPAGRNAEALWSALRIPEWAAGLPPSPVLDHVRNDLALLLAGDLRETLEETPIPPQSYAAREAPEAGEVNALDTLMGLWAYSREIARAVETLAGPHAEPEGTVRAAGGDEGAEGSLLR